MRTLVNIFDVSPMLYAGQLGTSKNSYTASANSFSNGVPIGGIRYLLRRAISDMYQGHDILFVFDSKTDKNQLYDGYKSNRTRNPDIFIQQEMFEDVVRSCNLPYLKLDNYEADDLVAYAVLQLTDYPYINIITSDMDLAANIYTPNIVLQGASSLTPTITSENFSWAVKSDSVVEYNTILPYFLFMGKPSNNVKAFKDKQTNYKLLMDYCEFCNENKVPVGQRSMLTHMATWLLNALQIGKLSQEDAEELLARTKYIYPKVVEPGAFTTNLSSTVHSCFEDVDNEKLAFFLKVFNLDSVMASFGMSEHIGPKTKEMFDYENSYKKSWNEGTFSADASNTADMSFFITQDTESTAVFVQEDDF